MANTIDRRVGDALARFGAARPDDLQAAAREAGLDEATLAEVVKGDRRLSARELYVLSRRLPAPVKTFYAPPVDPRDG